MGPEGGHEETEGRQTGRKREFHVSNGAARYRGFIANTAVIAFLSEANLGERVLVATALAEGEELGSNILSWSRPDVDGLSQCPPLSAA